MAFDGLVISNIVYELNQAILDGRIYKISQPEKDALVLTIKKNTYQYKLFLSASASLPLIYLTQESRTNPAIAPNFCMLLRKHLGGARIIGITQPSLERIIHIQLEHLNELGDPCIKYLIIEIMGKHSNIIFCDASFTIIDSIKHISGAVSSVREVLPGRSYFIPETQHKLNPLTCSKEDFLTEVLKKPVPISKAIYTSLTGISPLIANEICYRASLDGTQSAFSLTEGEQLHLYRHFEYFIQDIKEHNYIPNIVYDNQTPVEFSCLPLTCYNNLNSQKFDSISVLLESYYSVKETLTRIRQKSTDLRRVITTALERTRKKLDLQLKQLEDTKKREKYKIYGELIHTYGYDLAEGSEKLTAFNYYTNEEITIPLDPSISPSENAKKYFDKYTKLKRTFDAVTKQIEESKEELSHLESISSSLDIALQEEDLIQIKEELIQYGYIKRHSAGKNKRQKITSKPFHYLSSDGFHIYVGKNNFQNDELTFQSSSNDWWFHAKGIAGSHVVVKAEGEKLSDRTFEEAARLAAFYSKGRENGKVEIDYTEKKNIKKPNGSKPGFVVYYTNFSMVIEPDITGIQQIKEKENYL